MTNLNDLKNTELKSAHIKADVGNKEVSAEMKDKHAHIDTTKHAPAHKPM